MDQRLDGNRVTMDDIASASGFSKATVSRVINRDGTVKPATAARIEETIRHLGYVPNTMASALSGGKSRMVAVLLPDVVTEYYASLLTGIDQIAEECDYTVVIKTRDNRKSMTALANGNRVDAFIMRNTGLRPIDHDFLVLLRRLGIPYVFIGKPPEDHDAPAVLIDNIGGARQMAHHYAAHGFKKILFLAGPPDNLDSNDRLYGFKMGLSEKGHVPERLDLAHGDFTQDSGYEVSKRILGEAAYDAIFCANDQMALGAILYCRESGIEVPGDVAVTGFDDTFFSQHLIPSLTTVRQPMHDIGAAAMETVIQLLERKTTREHKIILPTRLQVRHSCGCSGA